LSFSKLNHDRNAKGIRRKCKKRNRESTHNSLFSRFGNLEILQNQSFVAACIQEDKKQEFKESVLLTAFMIVLPSYTSQRSCPLFACVGTHRACAGLVVVEGWGGKLDLLSI
jgi:hypothetical protein